MINSKTHIRRLGPILLLMVITGCSSSPGPDSISSHKPPVAGAFPDCLACHSPANPSLDPLQTNGSGAAGKHVAHVTDGGVPCIKCHYQYIDQATHMNGTMDTSNPAVHLVNFDPATNPAGVWTKTINPLSGVCSSLLCHGTDTPDWYGPGGGVLFDCPTCHSYSIGTRRQILGPGGDFAANPSITSHHVSGANDPNHDQCLVCHDQSTHTAGTVRLKNADTGASIAYTSPSSLEAFCLSCHDSSGAFTTFVSGGSALNPFADGSVLGTPPYPYATRIAGSWAKSFGHGPNGNHDPVKKLTCLGAGQPGTGCHGNNGTINAHGSVNEVLAARGFKYNIGGTYVESDYDLCFSCHFNYAGFTKEDTLGVRSVGILDAGYGVLYVPNGNNEPTGSHPPYYIAGVTTHFADHNDPLNSANPYNDPKFWNFTDMNLHWFHLGWPSYLRGDTLTNARIICVNCHDVHGSSTSYGAIYDEIGYYHFGDGTNILGQMLPAAYDQNQNYLGIYPTYCAFNCHHVQETTKAWFSPIVEGP